MKIASVVYCICAVGSAAQSAEQVVFIGTPVVRVTASPNESHRQVLDSGQQHEFRLLLTKEGGKYRWRSREGTELAYSTGGIYHFFAAAQHGYIKIGSMAQLEQALVDMEASGASRDILRGVLQSNHLAEWMTQNRFFYYEVITQGMFIGIHWGVGDTLSP